jgi:hypothetical protein
MTKLSIKADGTTLYKRPRNKRKERKWRKPEDK